MHSQSFVSVPPVIHDGKVKSRTFEEILAEPSLFGCSIQGAMMIGGPIVQDAIQQIQKEYATNIRVAEEKGLSAVIDVRVQRLMPDQYPSIPGWHCDYVPRTKYEGQPDFSMVHPNAFHVCLLLSDQPKGVSNTEYVNVAIRPKLWGDQRVYRDLHRQVERIKPDTIIAKDGQFVWFNQKTIHRARPCTQRGVRVFLRFSMIEKPTIVNKVVNQTQIYMLSEDNGW